MDGEADLRGAPDRCWKGGGSRGGAWRRACGARRGLGNRSPVIFRAVDPGRCVSFPPKAIGPGEQILPFLEVPRPGVVGVSVSLLLPTRPETGSALWAPDPLLLFAIQGPSGSSPVGKMKAIPIFALEFLGWEMEMCARGSLPQFPSILHCV